MTPHRAAPRRHARCLSSSRMSMLVLTGSDRWRPIVVGRSGICPAHALREDIRGSDPDAAVFAARRSIRRDRGPKCTGFRFRWWRCARPARTCLTPASAIVELAVPKSAYCRSTCRARKLRGPAYRPPARTAGWIGFFRSHSSRSATTPRSPEETWLKHLYRHLSRTREAAGTLLMEHIGVRRPVERGTGTEVRRRRCSASACPDRE